MATIRDCFLVDVSSVTDLDVVYCTFLRNIQNQFKKYRKYYIFEATSRVDNLIYTSNIVMRLKNAILKIRKTYIPPDMPKLIVDS